jgi:hypothetical protein
MIQIALDRAGHELDRLRAAQNIVDLDPPDDPFHARQADALVAICTDAVLGDSGTDAASSPPVQMVVHVDYDVLTGANPNGRGHIENGPALSTAALRRLGCDSTIKTLIERDGVPIASGREKPTVSLAPAYSPAARWKPPAARLTTSTTGPTAAPPSSGTWAVRASSITSATTTECSTSTAPSRATCTSWAAMGGSSARSPAGSGSDREGEPARDDRAPARPRLTPQAPCPRKQLESRFNQVGGRPGSPPTGRRSRYQRLRD